MKTKHTPGPWKIAQQYKDEANYPIGSYRIGTDKRDGHDVAVVQCVYKEANARLIAAAPDLLRALEEIALYPTYGEQRHAEIIEIANHAIAKAEGSEE